MPKAKELKTKELKTRPPVSQDSKTNYPSIEPFLDSGSSVAELLSRALPTRFYERNTLEVAPDLLGKLILVQSPVGLTGGLIVETEAYRGDDAASHSCRGETPRTTVMFGHPGKAYVYFIYGMYEMLNFVTEPKGFPGAVLIRALDPRVGIEFMEKRRKTKDRTKLTSGPGKLCRALGIEMPHNGQNLNGPSLFVIDVGDAGFKTSEILKSERVGIRQGIEKQWRFFIKDSPYVSRAPQNKSATPVVAP